MFVCYRIIRRIPVTARDFYSQARLGRQRPVGVSLESWEAVSVFLTREQAIKQWRRKPHLGRFVARLELPDGTPRSEPNARGHVDVYLAAEAIRSCVLDVQEIEGRIESGE